MRIKKLTIENIKRISAVEITPEGDLIILSGKNGQGKSSIIDSICFALGGADAVKHTPKPLKLGEEKGKVIVEFDDYIVTRWWTSPDTSYIKVTTTDRAVYPSPQALLEKFKGDLTFDPLEFLSMKASDQIELLMNFIGKKDELLSLNKEYEQVYQDRSLVNKEFKKLKVYFDEIPIPADNIPDDEVDLDELNRMKFESLNVVNHRNLLREKYKMKKDGISKALDEIERLKQYIEDNKIAMIKYEEEEKALPVYPDLAEIDVKIEEGKQLNELIQRKKLKYRTENSMGDMKVEADQLTLRLEEIENTKKQIIEESKLPINDLNFAEGTVIYKGVPLVQCSQSEKIKISMSIGMAMNPKLRIMMSKFGNDIDEDNMKLLAEIAKENDYQLWLEKIEEHQFPTIIIEDGTIKDSLLLPSNKKKGTEDGNTEN